MGLLALPAMLRAGYSVKLSAGVITAGGCLGILIPPSVLLIVYGATAGVSVVKLYAGAFFPGLMLALLYVAYVMIVAKLKPEWAPPLPESERKVKLPAHAASIASRFGNRALPALFRAALTRTVPARRRAASRANSSRAAAGHRVRRHHGARLEQHHRADKVTDISACRDGHGPAATRRNQPIRTRRKPKASKSRRPNRLAEGVQEPPAEAAPKAWRNPRPKPSPQTCRNRPARCAGRGAVDTGAAFARCRGASAHPLDLLESAGRRHRGAGGGVCLVQLCAAGNLQALLTSFFPLAVMILAVLAASCSAWPRRRKRRRSAPSAALCWRRCTWRCAKAGNNGARCADVVPLWLAFAASIVWFSLFKAGMLPTAPPDWLGWLSMAAIGVWCVLACARCKCCRPVRESAFLTAKTSAMVCWLFVGSSIFSHPLRCWAGRDWSSTGACR